MPSFPATSSGRSTTASGHGSKRSRRRGPAASRSPRSCARRTPGQARTERWGPRGARARLGLPPGQALLELPSTPSVGTLVRALPRRPDEPLVHVYFHDTDLLDRRRALALRIALRVLALRRTPSDLDAVQRGFRPVKTMMFAVSRG